MERRFAERTRDEWAVLAGPVDACLSPVLDFSEATHHPHNLANRLYESEPFAQPGIARDEPADRMFALLAGGSGGRGQGVRLLRGRRSRLGRRSLCFFSSFAAGEGEEADDDECGRSGGCERSRHEELPGLRETKSLA